MWKTFLKSNIKLDKTKCTGAETDISGPDMATSQKNKSRLGYLCF